MRKISAFLCAYLDFWNGRYYVVEYDATEAEDLGVGVPLEHGRYLLCTLPPLGEYGASRFGVFRSRAQAERYIKALALRGHTLPIVPQHVTRIPKNHPLVQQSLWR